MISAVHITEWRCGFKLHQLYTLIAMHNRTLVARAYADCKTFVFHQTWNQPMDLI